MTKCNKILVLLAILGLSVTTVFAQETGVVINGVTWATRNVDMPGTFADNPEDAGMLYQWNRKIGWSSTDPLINSDDGITWDNSTASGAIWEEGNDPCPSGWHVPTQSEFQSLIESDSYWEETNGVFGRIFGSGENVIFLPAAGKRSSYSGTLGFVSTYGYYWSSDSEVIGGNNTYGMYFTGDGINHGSNKAEGFCVRCVKDGGDVGINEVSTDTENATVTGYFDVLGRKLNEEPKQGFYIIQYSNGTAKKVMKLKE
jgi:uncharacterized protein (TIGR02145 family)